MMMTIPTTAVMVVIMTGLVLEVTMVPTAVYRVAMMMVVMAVTFTIGFQGNVADYVKGGVGGFKLVVFNLQEVVILGFNSTG